MWLTDMIGLAAEAAIYLAVPGYVLSKIGPTHGLVVLLLAFWLGACIGRSFAEKSRILQTLSFLPVGVMFFMAFGKAERTILIPAFLMYGVRIRQSNWTVTYNGMTSQFQVGVLMYLVFSVLICLANFPDSFFRESVPIFSGWLLMTILNLRLLRAEELLADRKYRLMNLGMLLGIMAVTVFLGSEVSVGTAFVLIKLFYRYILSPIILVMVYICIGIPAYLIYHLILWIISLTGDIPAPEVKGQPQPVEFMHLAGQETVQSSELLKNLLIGGAILVFAVVAYLIIRQMTAGKREKIQVQPDTFTRESMIRKKKNGDTRKPFSSVPGDRIRNAYYHYLLLCRNREIPVDGRLASDRICENSENLGSEADRQELRRLWMDIRYGEKSMTKEDAKRARELVKKFQKNDAAGYAKNRGIGRLFGK